MAPEILNGLFTLGGASIGVIGTLFVARLRREKRQLTAYVFEMSPLVIAEPTLSPKIEISYDGRKVACQTRLSDHLFKYLCENFFYEVA